MAEHFDIYKVITDKIIEGLKNGIIPWQRPWDNPYNSDALFVSHRNGQGYSFLNCMLLMIQGGKPGEYLTLKQANDEGGSVIAGRHSKLITFWTMAERHIPVKDDETGEPIIDPATGKQKYRKEEYPMLKWYTVFHISDCKNVKTKYPIKPVKPVNHRHTPIQRAEFVKTNYLQNEGIKLIEDNTPKAYYSPIGDSIHLPLRKLFKHNEEYYSTCFHEMTHSTGAENRLKRDLSGRFGSQSYAREELVAEIGAAFLIHHTGIDTKKVFDNSVAYIQSWIKALKNDTKLIIIASNRAEAATKYILKASPSHKHRLIAHTRKSSRMIRKNTHIHTVKQLSLF